VYRPHEYRDGLVRVRLPALPIGLQEALLNERLDQALGRLDGRYAVPVLGALDAGSAADRISQHLARLIAGAIEEEDDEQRALRAVEFAGALDCSPQGPSSRPHLANLARLDALGVVSPWHAHTGEEHGRRA